MLIKKVILQINEDIFINYFLDRNIDENIFNNEGTLNKNYNSFKKKGIIASIFKKIWFQFRMN